MIERHHDPEHVRNCWITSHCRFNRAKSRFSTQDEGHSLLCVPRWKLGHRPAQGEWPLSVSSCPAAGVHRVPPLRSSAITNFGATAVLRVLSSCLRPQCVVTYQRVGYPTAAEGEKGLRADTFRPSRQHQSEDVIQICRLPVTSVAGIKKTEYRIFIVYEQHRNLPYRFTPQNNNNNNNKKQ